MLLTPDQARARLESEDNLATRFGQKSIVEPKVIKSAGKNRINLDVETRTEIAVRARLGEDQHVIAKDFGVTPGEVSHINTGRIKGVDEKQIDERIGKVHDVALDRLMTTLGFMDNDKLSGCDAKTLSGIAANMGRVIEKTSQKADAAQITNVLIYAPEIKQEKSFKTIEV